MEKNKVIHIKEISKDEFQVTINNFNKIKNSEIEKLKKKRSEEILKLLGLINPIIQKYMEENSISIILDKKNVFIANKNNDITKKLIMLIDENLN